MNHSLPNPTSEEEEEAARGVLVSGPDPYFGAVRRDVAGGCVRAREK